MKFGKKERKKVFESFCNLPFFTKLFDLSGSIPDIEQKKFKAVY